MWSYRQHLRRSAAANFSTPQLFLIANDLSDMQILALVDESDIGMIKNGLPVEFSVQAYPNETFSGMVQQVRLQSKIQDNVVNYTAVVAGKGETSGIGLVEAFDLEQRPHPRRDRRRGDRQQCHDRSRASAPG